MKEHKFITITTDELLDGTCITVELDMKTNKICICRNLKELIIIPIELTVVPE